MVGPAFERRGSMKVTNWGLFLLGVYLILAGLDAFGFYLTFLSQLSRLIALVAGVLIVMDTWRR